MKNKYRKLAVILLATICFMGCQQDDIIYPEQNAEVAATYLDLNELIKSTITVEGAEGSHILKVQSDQKWTLSSSQAWCTASEKEGFKYSIIPISFSENPWNEPRTNLLTFVINETKEEKTVTVVQKASETYFSADVTDLPYSIGGGEKSITLLTNAVEWEAQIVDEETKTPITWSSVTPTTGKGKATLTITVQSNTSGSMRKATLVITDGDKSLNIPIVQAEKLDAPIVTLEDNDAFLLSWDEITGVEYYKLKVTRGNNETLIDIPSGSSYNLDVIAWNDYIGMVSLQLFACATLEGVETMRGGEVIEVHNLFDNVSGNGTAGSEYIISKPRHLRNIGKYLDKHYKQTTDIDLTGVDMAPISSDLTNNTYNGNFTGVYDAAKGNIVDNTTKRSSEQYKIMNWTLNKGTNSYCGLFASIGTGGIVRNVAIENAVITGKARVGAIAGNCTGKIISCHTTGNNGKISTATTIDAEIYLGGIVGYLTEQGEVSHCSNTTAIEGTAGCVGGIVGIMMRDANNAPTVMYCNNGGVVVSNSKSPIGGVIGSIAGAAGAEPIKVTGCVNTGDVSGTQANNQVAGIAGRATIDTKISQSYNTGSITAMGSAAGIVARMGGSTLSTIIDCYNTGTIKSSGTVTNGNSNAAGILATCTMAAGTNLSIENCHNVGTMVTATGTSFASGLFHRTDGKLSQITMKNCFSLNEDSKSQNSDSNSFIANASSSYKNLSASEMTNTSSFTNWNFSIVWTMGNKYPTLQASSK